MGTDDLKAAVKHLSGADIHPKCEHKNSLCDLIEDPENICADKQGRVVILQCDDCGHRVYIHPETAYDLVHHG